MPRYNDLKTNFVAGELDPYLLGRSDIKHYFNGAERMRNVIAIPQGGAELRPGSRYISQVPLIPPGTISNVRMCEFQFNTEQTYLFVFHHLGVQIFRNDVLVASETTVFTSDDLLASETAEGDLISSGISWTQSKDTLLVFHENHPIQQIKRDGSHSAWVVSDFPLRNVARYDFGLNYTDPEEIGVDEIQKMEFPNPGGQGDWSSGDTFALILEDEETTNIKFSTVASVLASSMQDALRDLKNTSATGITVTSVGALTDGAEFTVTFSGEDGDRPWGSIFTRTISAQQVPSIDIFVETKGQYPGEVVWSATRGYPRCGVFLGGRLWLASTVDLPHWVWASRIGAESDFNSELTLDDYGIAVPADTSDVPAFTAIYAGRHLQFFSRSGEFYVPISDREAITPNNMALRRTTSRGCKAGLRVHEVDGATHFVQRRGNALREFIFADTEQAYQANNISLLAPHLMRDPVDFALRRSTSTTDADYEFFPNTDGTMTVFCTLRTQEVNAMTLWKTEGKYKAVAVVLDDAYFAIERTINGVTSVFIEKMDADLTVDCALSGGAATSATLTHLPSSAIEHLLDGVIQPSVTSDALGVATFTRPAAADWVAGLRFAVPDDDYPNLIWLIKTLPIEIALPTGSILGKKRRIVNLNVRLRATSALMVNSNRLSFQKFGSGLLDQKVSPFSGVRTIRGLLGWDRDGSIVIGGDQSLKASVLALSFGVSV